MPERIQLKRTSGWRLPPGAVSVARPSSWGNPFSVADAIDQGYANSEAEGRAVAVRRFREWLAGDNPADQDTYKSRQGKRWYNRRWMSGHLSDLRGRDLACWCPLPAGGQPDICHGAVLLEVANA